MDAFSHICTLDTVVHALLLSVADTSLSRVIPLSLYATTARDGFHSTLFHTDHSTFSGSPLEAYGRDRRVGLSPLLGVENVF